MKGFINVPVYVDKQGIITTNIGFENGEIAYIGDDSSNIEEICKLENSTVVPAFIDQHIHGAGGADCMDASFDALHTISTVVAREGTASFLATTMTQSEENIIKACTTIKDYINKDLTEGAEILGIHLEGPIINSKHVGAQPIQYVVKPSVDTFKTYNTASGNNIKLITMAVELDENFELTKYLSENKIVASIGHTGAVYTDVSNAVKAGLTNVTHTYNAQTPLHHREVGVVGSAMLFDELNCEIICDTIHVSVPAMQLLVKNKPCDKVTLVTDAMRAKGMPDGISELGGQTVIVKNGEARLENGALAGSVLKMNVAVKNLVEKVGLPFTKAIDCATINPAKNLYIDDTLGSIAVGKRANITVLDKEFNVVLTMRDGNIIYKN